MADTRSHTTSGATGRPLSELPKREGFKFRGIRKDGGRYMNCRLKHLSGCGMYIAAAGGYVYEDVSTQLSGWEPHPHRASRNRHNVKHGSAPLLQGSDSCADVINPLADRTVPNTSAFITDEKDVAP